MATLASRVKLWDHQQLALKTVEKYLRSSAPSAGRAALINIPTGGGKTALIALLAHEGVKGKRALVLAPRVGIRDQLYLELNGTRTGGFFTKQGVKSADLPRLVSKLESLADAAKRQAGDGIFLSTVQLLDQFRNYDAKAFSTFAKSMDLVVVDEGHYEPARSWSTTIRAFDSPTVLFTATPYRNDLRAFQIDDQAIHVTRFVDLVDERFLRHVEVVQAKSDGSPASFITSVLSAFKKQFGGNPTASKKLIVRCEGKEDVVKIGVAFKRQGFDVVGLHERFSQAETTAEPWKQRKPSDPEAANSAAIWIHQHKLLEGVDGPSFRAVAMYGPRGSVRALVQQVGRIVRNPGRKAGEIGLLLDHRYGALERDWERYKDYDKTLTTAGVLRTAPELVQAALKNLPPLEYISESFRQRFDLGMTIDVLTALQLPTSAHFLEVGNQWDFKAFRHAIELELGERALAIQAIKLDAQRYVYIYISWKNSPLLAEHYFVELALHALVLKKFTDHVAYLDTGGGAPLRSDHVAIDGPIKRSSLARVIPQTTRHRITSVTTRNAMLGPRSVRARYVSAASLADTAPFMDDFQHLATSLTGVVQDPWIKQSDTANKRVTVRRYVGFGRGYVSDLGPRVLLEKYFEWIESAHERITSKRHPPELLNRFARVISGLPAAPDPRNVLLDLDEARSLYRLLDDHGALTQASLELEDACSDCARATSGQPRGFTVKGHGRTFAATLRFERAARRYVLESNELSSSFQRTGDAGPGVDLVTFLNREQAFLVLPDTPNVMYANGAFFAPEIGTGQNFDADRYAVGQVLEPHPALANLVSEKGNRTNLAASPASWHQDSVFGWLDRNLNTLFAAPSLVVCDDMNTESADFIVLDKNDNRIVLVHCKAASPATQFSATALQEVSGQAKKNCGTINLFNPLKPPNSKRWHEAWASQWVAGAVNNRVRRGGAGPRGAGYGDRLWAQLQKRIQNPNVEREVWLVLGATLSASALQAELRKAAPRAEVIQTTYLLQSTLASIGSANAKLRVLCSP